MSFLACYADRSALSPFPFALCRCVARELRPIGTVARDDRIGTVALDCPRDARERDTRLQLRLCKERIRITPALLIGRAQTGQPAEKCTLPVADPFDKEAVKASGYERRKPLGFVPFE